MTLLAAPTFADPVIVDKKTNKGYFNPIWLNWFLQLVQQQNTPGLVTAGGIAGQLQFNDAGLLGGVTMTGDATINTSTGVITVPKVTGSFTAHGLLLGEGTGAFVATAAMTNGQIPVGQTGSDPLPKTVSGYGALAASGALTVSKVLGTSTNDDAAAGDVGEYLSGTTALGSKVTLTSGVVANIVTLSLTAGDWDVWGDVWFDGAAGTLVTLLVSSISTKSATLSADLGAINQFNFGNVAVFATYDPTLKAGPIRISLSGTANVYLVADAFFTISTCFGYGKIQARRRR